MSYKRSSLRNQKAKLAADYNELLKELSSREMTSIGCYTIGDTIGEGTYGKVKLGTHKLTGQQVAVKKISKQYASMIAREIHHHRQLDHPNIVKIYEIIVTESAIHIFSEYCPNGELFDLLASTGRFSEPRVQLWLHQLTSALQLCHGQGIVHRDLKLENILLDINNNCKICDFGFARFADNKQLLETFCGSLAYSAPEVIMRQKYTGPETDIWSLGVILYTLLAGELPFDDDSEITTQRKIVNVDYEMPGYFSPYAQDLIANLLKRNPADRLTMDQIINHPWMQHNLKDDSAATNMDTINNPTNSISTSTTGSNSSSSDDDDDEVEDDIDSDGCSSSTRYSSRSDLDSIFSNPRFKNDLMEEDEDDLMTEASFASFTSDQMNGKSGDIMQHHQHYRKTHGTGSTNYTDGSKFSPQVRFSLGMLRPEDKTKYSSRSLRFSAPTVSNRSTAISQPTFRSSLPLSLPSNRESIRPSYVSSISSADNSMTPTEQRLATILVAAGFDEYIVQSMRTNTCGTANTLWNMLMEKQQQQQHHDFYTPSSSPISNDRWSMSSSPLQKQHQVDSSCQTESSQPTVTRIDRMTQTDTSTLAVDLDKLTGIDTTRTTIVKRQSSTRSYSSVTNSMSDKPSHQSHQSISSSTSERSGWFTSVKSWFGGNTNKPEGLMYDTPLRPSQLRRHLQQQQQQQQQLASYRDFDTCPSSSQQNGHAQDELTPPIYRSGPIKYRRHTPQVDEWNQHPKACTSRMNSVLTPPPPTATTTPQLTADNLSIITTPKYVSSTAVPSHATEIDLCKYRPLSPPAPPAPPPVSTSQPRSTLTNTNKSSGSATAVSPVAKEIRPDLVPTTGKDQVMHEKDKVAIDRQEPELTSLPDLNGPFLKPHSSKSSPALLVSFLLEKKKIS
ncbi:kinase-like domain-containing protein [Chlamydoabsidia padenii]|nr:kinase-like domain-containing protein [Chlamydoabsidia padenii]